MNTNSYDARHTISIVVSTYLRSAELSNLLSSILKQTRKPMEIIIVDDNTPDSSINLTCEQYQKDFQEIEVPLFYAKNPKERSISIARNLGASMAKGNIVCFVDSDIILHQDFLQEVQKTFEKHPEALGVAGVETTCNRLRVNVRSHNMLKLFFLLNQSENSGRIFERPVNVNKEIRCEWFEGNAMAFKNSVLNEFKFDENLVKYAFLEDMLFTGQIAKAYPNRLIMTPKGKYVHTACKSGRMEGSNEKEIRAHYLSCRKYVLTTLFGHRGLFIFGWQNMGVLIFKTLFRIQGNKGKTGLEVYSI